MLDLLGDAVILVERDRRIRYVNERAERLTGWSLREAQAMAIQDACPLVDAATGEALTMPPRGGDRHGREHGVRSACRARGARRSPA